MKHFSMIVFVLVAATTMASEDWESWSLEELEKQMSPSRWNPAKTPEQVIAEYINEGLQDTKKAREAISCSVNVSYGSTPAQLLDIYGSDLPNTAPIFLWIHGGYWQEGSKDISGGLALNLHKIGIRTVVLGYTLAPDATIAKMEEELRDALKYIVQEFPNCNKIILGGHSAGAHLSASILYGSNDFLFPEIYDKLGGFVLVSGVYDLRPLVRTYVNIPLKMTLQEAASLSPLTKSRINENFKNKNIKVLFMYGTYDSPEFKRQSNAYKTVLKSEFETQDYVANKDDHFTIVQNLEKSSSGSGQALNKFMQTYGSPREGRNEGASLMPQLLLSLISAFQYIIHIL